MRGMTHNQMVLEAFARGVRPRTTLQDAVMKVRLAYRGRLHNKDTAFELALGELFALASEAFRKRNGYYAELLKCRARIAELESELRAAKEMQCSP